MIAAVSKFRNMQRLMRAAAVALVLCAAALAVGCAAVLRHVTAMASAVQLSYRCVEEAQQGHPRAALRDCDAAVKLEPDDSSMYYYRAFAYGANADFRRQVADLDHALQLSPTFADAFAERCGTEWKLPATDIDAAISDCDEAVKLDPRGYDIVNARLALRTHLKDYHGALEDAATLAELRPNSADGHLPACQVYVAMGQFAQARQSCDRAEQAPQDKPQGYRSGAIDAALMADWPRALADADQAVALASNDAEAYNDRCWIRIRMNDIRGAKQDCATALTLSSNDPHIRDTRADILIRERDYKGVIADENAAVDAYPSLPFGFAGRCAAERELGEIARALADCRRAVSLERDNGEWLVLLGDVYRSQEEPTLARASYRRAFGEDPTAIEALRGEALLDEASGDAQAAAELAAAYVARNGYDPVGHEVYGKALARLGKSAAAVAQFELARQGYAQRGDAIGISEVDAAMTPLRGTT
jgi:tetratricopeptide (TPR) repeat protein